MGISAAAAAGDRPGHIKSVGFSTVDTGYLACDGAAVSRTVYSLLFAAIGATWGAGDGSTTFNVPDLRGRAPIGSGTGAGLTARALAGSGGEESHVQAGGEMANHGHTITASGNVSDGLGGTSGFRGLDSVGGTAIAVAASAAAAGSSAAANVMQPYKVVTFQIKT